MYALAACVLIGSLVQAPADPPRKLHWEAEAAVGVEYDSNATRLDSDESTDDKPVQSGLLRGQAHLGARLRPTSGLVLAGSYDLAGKVFWQQDARGQDTLIHRLTLALGLRLDRGLAAKVGLLYHEGFQRSPEDPGAAGAGLFDFRLVDGRLQLALAPASPLVAALAFGIRQFTYKPDASLSFDALLAAVSLDTHHVLGKGKRESELDGSLSYTVSRRRFDDEFEQSCPPQIEGCELSDPSGVIPMVTFPFPGTQRVDLVHRLDLEVTWVRGLLLQGGYELAISRSNSFGMGYQRHELRAKLVTPLFAKIYATVQLRARLVFYEAATVVLDDPGFEEENRSHVLVQLERTLTRGLRLMLRYTLFVGDLTSPDVANLRHLAFVGLVYRYASK